MSSRCLLYCSGGTLSLCLAMAHAASAGPFTRFKLGDNPNGGGGQPVEQAPSANDEAAPDSRFDLAAALVIGIPVGDYGSAVGTGFGVSAYGGYLVHPSPEVRIAIGPALSYQSYGAKGGGGSAGLFDITAQARAEFDLPAAPGLTLFGDVGLGFGMFMVSVDGGGPGGGTQTHIGTFKLGGGAAYHVMPKLGLTGELAYEQTPTDGDAAGRITLAIGVSYAY